MPSEEEPYLPIIQQPIDAINMTVTSLGDVRLVLSHRTLTSPDAFTLSLDVCALLSVGAAAILTISPCDVTRQLDQLPALSHVPVIDLFGTSCDVTEDSGALPEAQNMLIALLDVMVGEHWDDVQIFYEAEFEAHTIWLVDKLSSYGCQTSIYSFSSHNHTALRAGSKVGFQHYDNFLVLASHNGTAWLLTQARLNDLDLIGPKYYWLVADEGQLQHEDLLQYLLEGDNVAIVTQAQRGSQLLQDSMNRTLPWVVEAVRSVVSAGKWTDDLRGCDVTTRGPAAFSHTRNALLTQLQATRPPTRHPKVDMLTLVPRMDRRLHWSLVGSWSATSGYVIDEYLYPDVKRGFNNRTFIITTVHYPPFMVKTPNGTFEGICFDILEELQRVMNFSYKIVEPADQLWGVRLPNGTHSGMFGLLEQKKADFGVGIFGVTSERQKVVDFTTPFLSDPTIVLMSKPNLASSQVFICLGPFHYSVWFLIALSVLLVGGVLWFLVWYHPLHDIGRREDLGEIGIYDPRINIWQVFGAIMQQGMVYLPESHSARLLITSWWLYVIVVVGTYNGNLIAFLTAPKVYTPVNSLQELADSGMKFGVMRGAYAHGVFQTAKDGVYSQLWDSIKDNEDAYLVSDNLDGMQKALHNRNYAFLLEKSFYDTLANKDSSFQNKSCEFARAKESFMNTFYAFPFQKNSPYTELFSKRLLRILEAGLVQRWQRHWYAVVHRCTGLERTTEQTNISLAEAQGAFYILGIGLMVATLFLFSEKVVCSATNVTKLKSQNPQERRNESGEVANVRFYQVGSLPSAIPTATTTVTVLPMQERQNQRRKEINSQYPAPAFSPYAKWKQRKVRKSHSFPILFKSCCRKTKKGQDDSPQWELPTQNGYDSSKGHVGLNGHVSLNALNASSNNNPNGVAALFSYGPSTAWYDQYGRTSRTHMTLHNANLGRRWFSENDANLNGHLVKDVETGEFHNKDKDKQRD